MIDFDLKNREQATQLVVGAAAFAVIALFCLIIMAPFFPAILLATIFALATWPAFVWIDARLKGRTGLAALLMTALLACCFIFPLVIIGSSMADNFTQVYTAVQGSLQGGTDDMQKTLTQVPYVGPSLQKSWSFFAADKARLSAVLQEYAAPTSQQLIAFGGKVGRGLFDVTLGVLIAYFFFRHGRHAAVRLDNLTEKFTGARGRHILDIAKKTLIGVVYGILGTALAQGMLGALGFWVAGVPGAPFLGLLTFFLSLIPMGPPLIWAPAAFWLYSNGAEGWAVFLALWGIFVISSIDNFLKPYFISLGSDLPLLLVLLGILGGIFAFGFIGVFIGPTVLAVAYSLIIEWSSGRDKPA